MDKKDKQNLTNLLVSKLDEFYLINGFERKIKGASRFENKELTVFWGATAEYSTSLVFRPWFRVINEKLSEILKKLFPNQIGIEFTIVRVQSPELIEELEIENYISNYIHKSAHGVSYYYSIEKDTPLDPIVEDHINFMTNVGMPFLKKVNTLDGINEYINGRFLKGDLDYFGSEERKKELQPYFSQREVLSGITSAYLINNSDIDKLLNRYRIFFKGNNYVLEPMEKVVKYLEKIK